MTGDAHCATHQGKGPNASCHSYCGCRCPGCIEAKRVRDVQWRQVRRRLYPQPTDKVPADRACEMLQHAHDRGYTDRQIARACDLTSERVWEIRTNKRTTVLRRTGRRIVAGVRRLEQGGEPPARADGMVVRAMLVWLRERGASDRWIGEQIGTCASQVWHLRRGHMRGPQRQTADRIRQLRDEVLAGRQVPPGHGANARLGEGAGR